MNNNRFRNSARSSTRLYPKQACKITSWKLESIMNNSYKYNTAYKKKYIYSGRLIGRKT